VKLALRRRSGRSSEPPAASFAAILDGHLLWVAVPARPGRLALRRADTAEVLDVAVEDVTDQSAYLAARIDLSGLDGAEDRYDVVLVSPGQDPVALLTPPLPRAAVRPSRDDRTEHTLVRSPDGTLRVRTTLLPTAASLLAVRRLDDALEVTLTGAGRELAVLDDDDRPLVSWPVAGEVVTITRESLAGLAPITRPAVTGSTGHWRPVRRRDNDLADPRSGAPLPQIDHPEDDRPLLRLPWSRAGLLQVRVFGEDGDDA
jgi:hypothetical protein